MCTDSPGYESKKFGSKIQLNGGGTSTPPAPSYFALFSSALVVRLTGYPDHLEILEEFSQNSKDY